MEKFITKQEQKLYRALEKLLHNSIDHFGLPKKATTLQLKKAQDALSAYEKYEHKTNGRL